MAGAGDAGPEGEINAVQQGQPNPLAAAAEELVSPPPPPTENKKASTEQENFESRIDLYGFIMLDSGYDFKTNNPNWFDVVRPTQLPVYTGEFAPDGKVYYGVRQTRFGVKTLTPTKFRDLKTQFEFELFGTGVDAGQTTFSRRRRWRGSTTVPEDGPGMSAFPRRAAWEAGLLRLRRARALLRCLLRRWMRRETA